MGVTMENQRLSTDQAEYDGRVRPAVLGVLIVIAGLLIEKSWWQLGVVILIAVFVEASARYRWQ